MAYKALYRKYRPQRFDDVFGQEIIIKTLKNSIKNNKISHAYLFSGPRGIGKTSIARIFAKALNCKNINDHEPCLECKSCIEIANGSNPDVIEIDAASNNGVDEIRDIREKVKFLPVGAKYKIYIIDEVHMLSQGAFNALLKTLEEPPHHAVFILATTELHKIPATIISRCQCFEFKALTISQISNNVKAICEKENIKITDDATNAISLYSEGGMRDALSILDQAISFSDDEITEDVVNEITGSLNYNNILNILVALENRDIKNAMNSIEDLLDNGKEASKVINSMLDIYKDVLVYKNVGKKSDKSIYEKQEFINLVNNINEKNIYYYVDILTDLSQKIKYVSNPRVILEVGLIRITNASGDALRLAKKIEELERRIDEVNIHPQVSASTVVSENSMVAEEKINNVVVQLNKLNLPEVISRVNELENKVSKLQTTQTSNELASIQEDILLLKTKNASISDDTNNDSLAQKIDSLEADINRKLISNEKDQIKIASNINEVRKIVDELELKISSNAKEVISETNINYDEIKGDLKGYIDKTISGYNINTQLAYLEAKIDKVGSNLNQESMHLLEQKIEEIDQIKRSLQNHKYTQSSDFDLSEIKNKIINIENKLHKYIAIINQDEISVVKKTKSSKNNVVYYGEGLFSIDEYNNTKINVEFDSLQKDEDDKTNDIANSSVNNVEDVESSVVYALENKVEDDVEKNEEIISQSDVVIEDNQTVEKDVLEVVEKPEIKVEENKKDKDLFEQFGLFDDQMNVIDIVSDKTTATDEKEENEFDIKFNEVINKEEKLNTQDNSLEMEKSDFDIEKPKTLEELKEELNIDAKIDETKKEIDLFNNFVTEKPKDEIISKVETENATIITKTNSQLYKRNQEANIYDIFSQERNEVEKKMNVVTERVVEKEVSKKKDEFDSYDVSVIERILNESRTEEAKGDKARVLKIWNILDKNVDYSQVDIAQLLKLGEVKAVGRKEFIITYPSIIKCNQVMRQKFKSQAKKFLYDKLGDSYNYMALPDEVWNNKRQEYATQYYTGSKYPKLSPIDENIIRQLVEDNNYKDDNDKAIDKVKELFGSDLVTVE